MKTAPYGSWPSPISAADVAQARRRLSFPVIREGHVWWQQTRPEENGRTTIAYRAPSSDEHVELLADPWDARTRVHEYGGRSYLPVRHGDGYAMVFANFADQRLYRLDPGSAEPVPLSPEPSEPAGLRYADFTLSPDGAEIWCVCEGHVPGGVRRAIVAVPLDGSGASDPDAIRELVSGADFFASPTPSPDGRHLAWVAWNHPRMPWDGTELRVAIVEPDGSLDKPRTVKGGTSESVLAPVWRDERTLYVISDWSGWWNLYQVGLYGDSQALYPAEEEFGGPLWQLGTTPYVRLDDGRLAVLHGKGDQRLGLLDPETAELTDVDLPYTSWSRSLSADGATVVGVAGSPVNPMTVLRADLSTGSAEALRQEFEVPAEAAYLPTPREVELEGPFGRPVYAFVYPPSSPSAGAPEGELPPYLVHVHGGPTGHSTSVLDLEKAFFTSRGIGVVDVNYGGSTGYGRTYRERLRGQWGVVDVEDAVAAAQALVKQGVADGDRLAIRGGSAGGWTTLSAITRSSTFKAGTSYFGISDPLTWAGETHDFESKYLFGLIGPLPGFEKTYEERSPLSHAEKASCPVLLLQGMADPIVLPVQSEKFANAMASKEIPYAYLTFDGEAHGFRQAETIRTCLESELSFYGQTLGFEPPGVSALELLTGRPPITIRS